MAGKPELYDEVMTFIDKVGREEYDKCKERQKDKFDRLKVKSINQEDGKTRVPKVKGLKVSESQIN